MKGFTTCHPSSSIATPITTKPWSLYLRSKSINQGISIWQGPHQVAQKSTMTVLPRKSDSFTVLPFTSFNSKLGASLRSLDSFTDCACAVGAWEQARHAIKPHKAVATIPRFHKLDKLFLISNYISPAKPAFAPPTETRRQRELVVLSPAQENRRSGVAKTFTTILPPGSRALRD